MSYDVHFSFSWGLAKTITVPAGTKARAIAHVEETERLLGLKRLPPGDGNIEVYGPNYPDYWDGWKRDFSKIDEDVLCQTVEDHNNWVREMYANLDEWSKTPFAGNAIDRREPEQLTPEDAREFWHGFEIIELMPEFWNRDYYRARMESLYWVMRGAKSEGVCFDAKPLTQQQADSVLNIFSTYLDRHDLRLSVVQQPGRGFNGLDMLASSYDGGYDYCDGCFKAIDPDSIGDCRRRKCPLQKECAV